MIPTTFKDQNCVFAENQPEYQPLPALKINDKYGSVITCWKMSFKERIRAFITGKIWISEASFNKPLTPISAMADKKDIYTIKK
jgi:hypothetical protein